MRIVWALLICCFSAIAHGAEPPPTVMVQPAVIETTVSAVENSRSLVSFSVGQNSSICLNDLFWVIADSKVVCSGTIFIRGHRDCAGKWTTRSGEPAADQAAVILRQSGIVHLRDMLPDDVLLRGEISRVPPGRLTAWLNIGKNAGLKGGDTVLVRRRGLPIARGWIDSGQTFQDELSLAVLSPVVGNALPQAGDSVELWPAPWGRRWGRVNSTILAVQSHPEGALLTLVGTAADGLSEGRLINLWRANKLVGVAAIRQVGQPLSVAQVIDSATLIPPIVGDTAMIRSPAGPPAGPLAAPIFRIEGNICLLAAGESDGLVEGEKLIVRQRREPAELNRWQEVAELSVYTVKVDYAGARIRPLADEAKVQLWDMAERRMPRLPKWRTIGIVGQVMIANRSAEADVEAQGSLTPGDVVRWVPEDASHPEEASSQPAETAGLPARLPGAAIVVYRLGDHALLYVPPGWGELNEMARARVEVPSDEDWDHDRPSASQPFSPVSGFSTSPPSATP